MELLTLLVMLVYGLGGVEGALEVNPAVLFVGNGATDRRNHREANFSCIEVCPGECFLTLIQIQPDTSPQRPRSVVVWMKDGQVIDTSSRKYRNYGKKKKLLIRELTETDGGVYECAFTANATEKGRAELWIAPRILEAPSPQTLVAGSNQIVVCHVSAGVRAVEWSVNGEVVASEAADSGLQDQGSRYSIRADGSLQISPILPSDRGTFNCFVSNKAGQEEANISVAFEATNSVGLTMDQQLVPVSQEPIMITCTSDVTTPPPVEETTPTTSPGGTPTLLTLAPPDSCAELLDVSFQHPDTFSPSPPLTPMATKSTIRNSSLRDMPVAMVYTVPTFTVIPPPCARTLVGYSIVFHCSATSDPPPTITWFKEDEKIASSEPQLETEGVDSVSFHYQLLPDDSLKINTVQVSDRGRYTCTASNSIGSISEGVKLKVVEEGAVCGVGGGRERQRRVVDGVGVAGPSNWPWQVLIEYPTLPNPDLLCGGALVRPDWVVTAAHCLRSPPFWLTPDSLNVRVGVWNRSRDEPSQQRLEVQEIFIHPEYSSSTALPVNDIALLKLRHPARLTSSTGLVCLPQKNEDPPAGTECVVTGWGHLQYGSSSSPLILHQATVPLVSHSECRHQRSYGNRVTLNLLCAGHEEGGADSCQNDSGGPLVCLGEDGRYVLRGVVNSGDGCGKPHKYGIYARIMKFRRWITTRMAVS